MRGRPRDDQQPESSDPIFGAEPRYAGKLPLIVGDQHGLLRKCMRGGQQVHVADGCALRFQHTAH